MMKRFTLNQKITVIGVAVLLLVAFMFPPWKSRIGSHHIFESAGYKFILAPPEGFDVSIDPWRMLIQSLVIIIAGFIGFCLFTWRTPRVIPKPSFNQSLPDPKKVKCQKFIILCVGILILVSVLFPPWIGPIFTYRIELDFKDPFESKTTVQLLEDAGFSKAEIEEYLSRRTQEEELEWLKRETKAGREPKAIYKGYRFIFNPPNEITVSINSKRLIFQIIGLLLIGGFAFLVVSLLFQEHIEEIPSNKSISNFFKNREEYEQWKNKRLQLISQKRNIRSPRLFSLKSIFLAVIITSVLIFFMAVIDTTGNPPKGIEWTIMWMALTVESWKYWKWKALIPYPSYLLLVWVIMIVLSEIGTELLTIQIIKGAIHIAFITVFFIIYYRRFKKEKAKSKVFERVRKISTHELPVSK